MNRVGFGYDVHKFGPLQAGDNPCIAICGVMIPYKYSIEAHSDGDVGIHALVDAILGALGEGDIGEHFPPSDPQWRGADSAVFLEFTAKVLQERGAVINNIDITIVCERPKILPYMAQIRERLGVILGLGQDRISVKGKTNEKLGFIGRQEGIAAYCICSIELPAS